MQDQAAKLRQLGETAGLCAPAAATGPPMIAVAGGRAGVGATTVAVNLAAALADRGARVLLVDAAEQRTNLAEAAGVRRDGIERSVFDVMAGRCGIAEALVVGPVGTILLAARDHVSLNGNCESSPHRIFDRRNSLAWSRHSQQRLLAGLRSLGGDFDMIVMDVGSGLTPWTRRTWLRSRLVLLVSTTDGPAVVDSYAAIKFSAADAIAANIHLLMNQCESNRIAAVAHARLSSACERFLRRAVPALPSLPRCTEMAKGEKGSWPRVWDAPNTPFGHAAMWLGRAVGDLLSSASSMPPASIDEDHHPHPELSPC